MTINPPSIDIKNTLVSDLSLEFGKNLFIGKMPSSPTDCITMYDTASGEQQDRLNLDNDSIQFMSRNVSYFSGYEALLNVRLFLQSKAPFIINNTSYIGFWAASNISFIGCNETDRYLWTFNMRTIRKLSDSGNRNG